MQWEMTRLPSILASCCANATISDRKQLSFFRVFASFNKKIASNTHKQTGHTRDSRISVIYAEGCFSQRAFLWRLIVSEA
jgi:hypothetical protein